MVAAGEGYRAALGWVVLTVDIILFLGGHALLVWRRQYQPLKAWSPVLLHTTLMHFIPGMLWVPIREITGGGWIRCDHLVWMIIAAGVSYALPVLMIAYRLFLIADFEKNKIAHVRLWQARHAHATSGAAAAGGGHHPANKKTALIKSGGAAAAAAADPAAGTSAIVNRRLRPAGSISNVANKPAKSHHQHQSSGGAVGAVAGSARTSLSAQVKPATTVIAVGGGGGTSTPPAGATSTPPRESHDGNGAAGPRSAAGLNTAGAVSLVIRHTNSRLIFLLVAGALFPVVSTLIFFGVSPEDFSGHGSTCTYYSLVIVPIALEVVFLTAVGGRVIYLLWVHKVTDNWGIRNSLLLFLNYSNLGIGTWILLNVFDSQVNQTTIESGLFAHLIGSVSAIQMVFYPTYLTFKTSQQPKSLRIIGGKVAGVAKGVGMGGHWSRVPGATGGGGGGGGGGASRYLARPSGTRAASTIVSIAHSELRSHDLWTLITDPDGYQRFLAFVQGEFSAENLLFFSAVEEFAAEPTLGSALYIRRTFVVRTAPLCVNLSGECIASIEHTFELLAPYISNELRHDPTLAAFVGTTSAAAAGGGATAIPIDEIITPKQKLLAASGLNGSAGTTGIHVFAAPIPATTPLTSHPPATAIAVITPIGAGAAAASPNVVSASSSPMPDSNLSTPNGANHASASPLGGTTGITLDSAAAIPLPHQLPAPGSGDNKSPKLAASTPLRKSPRPGAGGPTAQRNSPRGAGGTGTPPPALTIGPSGVAVGGGSPSSVTRSLAGGGAGRMGIAHRSSIAPAPSAAASTISPPAAALMSPVIESPQLQEQTVMASVGTATVSAGGATSSLPALRATVAPFNRGASADLKIELPVSSAQPVPSPSGGPGAAADNAAPSPHNASLILPDNFGSLFDIAQREVFLLMECDSYARFKNTPAGKEWIAQLNKAPAGGGSALGGKGPDQSVLEPSGASGRPGGVAMVAFPKESPHGGAGGGGSRIGAAGRASVSRPNMPLTDSRARFTFNNNALQSAVAAAEHRDSVLLNRPLMPGGGGRSGRTGGGGGGGGGNNSSRHDSDDSSPVAAKTPIPPSPNRTAESPLPPAQPNATTSAKAGSALHLGRAAGTGGGGGASSSGAFSGSSDGTVPTSPPSS